MFIKYKCVVLSLKQNVIFKPHLDLAFSSPQLLQTSPILCSTWTTTSSIGKAWMRGSCTACDHLPSRCCSVCALGLCNLRQTSSLSLGWGGSLSLPAQPAKGLPRLHSPASVAHRASTCPSIQRTTEGLPSWQAVAAVMLRALRACRTRTVTNRHGHAASLRTSCASQAITV